MWSRTKKLRVLTVGSVPPEWGGLTDGGVAVVHAQVVTTLSSTKGSVEVAGVVATNAHSIMDGVPSQVKVLIPPKNVKDEKRWYFDVLDTLKPDCVVFFHIAHRWAIYHAESSVPMVGAIHSWNQITRSPELKSIKAKELMSHLLPRCNSLVFPSMHTAKEGMELGFKYSSSVHIAHNPLSSVFSGVLSNCDSSRNVHSVASVGALEPIKRMDYVVRGGAACGADVLIIGRGSEGSSLQILAQTLSWDHRVSFYNRIPQSQIAELLPKMGIFACPSRSESFGNVYIEALACGLPIIGFKETFSEIEDKMGMPIGTPLDGNASFEEFHTALESVLMRRWDRQDLSKRVKEIFAPESALSEYVAAIKSAVN